MIITIGEISLTATLAENSSAKELSKLLMNRSITIPMKDYGGFEKVGPLGQNLPTNDEPISTKAGDLILYQGNSFVIYYSTNSWNFTRLGQIDNITADELKQILGSGDITVTLSITK
ncbi:MAG: hypothetical protein LBT47_14185 [Deltaproteobacteria bacterium]|nr:hypothetical protein [Deltaproteobacteria bacterium]